ncbi:hypothetical protein OAL43_01650 [bacterium]|nr:hypothetical protein [bacterium]
MRNNQRLQWTSFLAVAITFANFASGQSPINIGNRREMFVDQTLIDSMDEIELRVHQPQPREMVFVTDQPWEGNTCAYYTIFEDEDRYRMYYRGSHWDTLAKKATHPEVVCYAESTDGIHWVKPKLGICEFDGSRDNNIIWDGVGTHNFTPFKDTNPNCAKESRYKALARGRSLRKGDTKSKHGLFAFRSADGIHWELMSNEPVITEGAFDSQNLAFYDQSAGVYRDYHRWFNEGVRDIMQCTSKDFLTWSDPKPLTYGDQRKEHLYTNAIRQYYRAPHLFIGFPTRYLPNQGQRVEPIFMSSRDGLHFSRFPQALITEDAPKDRQGNRSNYMTNGLLTLVGSRDEMSMYATEAYYTGPDSRVRRFVIRTDGFISAHAGSTTGYLLTKPILFSGDGLEINYQAAQNGSVRAEIQTLDGGPIAGFSFKDCPPMIGDSIAAPINWKSKKTLESLSGKPIRLRFEIKNAEVYAFKFQTLDK